MSVVENGTQCFHGVAMREGCNDRRNDFLPGTVIDHLPDLAFLYSQISGLSPEGPVPNLRMKVSKAADLEKLLFLHRR